MSSLKLIAENEPPLASQPSELETNGQTSRAMLPALTGVRAIAMYLVFFHHFNPPESATGSFVRGLIKEGHLGVTMFFVLSGFLIAYRYSESLKLDWKDFSHYVWNRFARIYPLYFLLLIPTLLLSGERRGSHWFFHLTFTKGFFDEFKFTGIAQAWSLAAEECFYILAPLFFWGMRSRFRAWVLPSCYGIAAALLLLGSTIKYHQFFGNAGFVCSYTFFGRAFEFLLGAWIATNLPRMEVLRSLPGKTYMGLIGIIAALAILDGLKVPGQYALGVLNPRGILVNNWFAPLAIGLFYVGLIQERTLVQRLFCSRLFQILGKSSYAYYLIHIGFISKFYAERLQGVSFFLALNVTAIVIFLIVEEPIQRFLRNRFRSDAPEKASAMFPLPSNSELKSRAAA